MENATNGKRAHTILEVSMSYAVPRCLHVIAEIGFADAGAVARALRLLSAHGIVEPCNDGYVHTPGSLLLRTDHPQSMRSLVRMVGGPIFWKGFELVGHSPADAVQRSQLLSLGGD